MAEGNASFLSVDVPNEHLRYQEIRPSPRVAHIVSAHWSVKVGEGYPAGELHHIWPDGAVSISAVLGSTSPDVSVVGPRTSALQVPLRPYGKICGVRLRPDIGATVLGVAATRIRDYVGSISPFQIGGVDTLTERISADHTPQATAAAFDDWLWAHAEPVSFDPVIRMVVQTLIESHGCEPVATVAESHGLGLRQLQRRFGNAVGLTPKQFARIRRLRAALARLLKTPRASWSAIAAELQFADHAHLVRDMAKLTGLTPTQLASRIDTMAHVDVQP